MCLMNFCQQPGTVSCYALTAIVRFDQFGFIFLSSASSADAPQRDGSSWRRRRDDNVDNFYFIRQRCKLDKIKQKEEVQSKSVSEKL